jgi:hypothetical protein
MGDYTRLTAFDAVVKPDHVSSAPVAAEIKRAITKQAVEIFRRIRIVAGESLTFFITEERIGFSLPRFISAVCAFVHPIVPSSLRDLAGFGVPTGFAISNPASSKTRQ